MIGIRDAGIAIIDLEFEIAIYGVNESHNQLPGKSGLASIDKPNVPTRGFLW